MAGWQEIFEDFQRTVDAIKAADTSRAAFDDIGEAAREMAEAVHAAARITELTDFAALIDRGPTFSLPPSIFSAMARERAEDLQDEDAES